MKLSTLICFLLFLAGVSLFLAQMWFQLWTPDLFFKIIVTDAALFVIGCVTAFLIKENRASDRTNKGNSLD
ncbi:MAG: hypothetical protein M3N08_08085 [Pseudomonadota bacterium]|nr:hypothetical protein [Pseudomonadota bacterium]